MHERGKKVTYINKDKQVISQQQYEELKRALEPKIFENKTSRVVLAFNGELEGPMVKSIPPEHWMPFEVRVFNRLHYGTSAERFVRDPDGDKKFRTEKEAIDYYQTFLVRWCGCFGTLNDDGSVTDFIEDGNMLGHEAMAEQGVPVVKGGAAAAVYGEW